MTLFVSHNNTDYKLVKKLYDKGMDIAVHGINHIKANSIEQFTTEALGQRENLATKANIPKSEIVGYRSPYLIVYGNEHFEILKNAGLKYDSTLTITKRSLKEDSPFPFTLDNGWPYPCNIPNCPTRAIPGFWELPVVSVIDRMGQYPCVYVDGCINEPLTEEESYNFLLENFRSYYNRNKAPFGLNMHSTWLLREYETNPYRMRAMNRFLDYILSLNDVYVINMKQTMQWMKQQPPLGKLSSFLPFQCNQTDDEQTMTMAPGNVSTEETHGLKIMQKHFRSLDSHPDSTAQNVEDSLQQQVIKAIFSFRNLDKKASNISTADHGRRVITNRKQWLMNQETVSDAMKSIRHKRNSGDDMTGAKIWKNPKRQITNILKKNNLQKNINNRKVVSTTKHDNVFRLMAKLTIGNITERNIKISTSNNPSSSQNAIFVRPAQFSHKQILVDPTTHNSDSRNRVVLVHNKDTARILNSIQKNKQNPSGSEVLNSDRKLSRWSPNLSKAQKIKEPSETNIVPPIFAALQHSELLSLNTNSNHSSLFESKTYSTGDVEKVLGISHTFANEIPTVNRTSTRECKQRMNCHLPGCQCQDLTTSLLPNQIPQFVYFTYEGSVNESIAQKLMRLFTPQRTNWDGCQIKGTVFVTSEGTNYSSIQKLYHQGLEIGLHGLKAKSLSSKLHSLEVAVQKYLLKRYAGIPESHLKGWRSSGLQSRGNDQFTSLKKSKLLYDSSLFVMTNLDNRTGMWPFTLDFGWQNNCMLQDCPTQTYPGLWEVPAVPYVGIKKRYLCKFVDSCYNQPRMSVQTYDFLLDNFMGIYKGDRKPFGVRIRSNWLQPGNEENFKGLDAFIELLQELPDVYVVSISDLINWMKDPVPHLEGEPMPEARKISC